MIDTLDDVEPPYREGDSDKVKRGVTSWPSVEDAARRIRVLVDPEVATDMAARDLIVLMRELGRVTAELAATKKTLAMSVSLDAALTSKATVEDIVARCETYQYSLPRDEQRALIRSWRERGEALRRLGSAEVFTPEGWGLTHPEFVARIKFARDALAAEPASGEANNLLEKECDRLATENRKLREEHATWTPDAAPPPPPTQDDGETALELLNGDLSYRSLVAALRKRADEATEAMRAKCEAIARTHWDHRGGCAYDIVTRIAALKDKP